jgi:hypothetical protein
MIATSNFNYDITDRIEDKRYIDDIIVTDDKYQTPRGISVGSSMEQVKEQYGDVNNYSESGIGEGVFDGVTVILCDLGNYNLTFYLDNEDSVSKIILFIMYDDIHKSGF